MKIKTLSKIVMREGGSIFDEENTVVSVDDESGGVFLTISQHNSGGGELKFNFEEWSTINKAVEQMIDEWG